MSGLVFEIMLTCDCLLKVKHKDSRFCFFFQETSQELLNISRTCKTPQPLWAACFTALLPSK